MRVERVERLDPLAMRRSQVDALTASLFYPLTGLGIALGGALAFEIVVAYVDWWRG